MKSDTFADILCKLIYASGYSVRRAAERADLPNSTVRNWKQGRVRQPQQWQDILRLARGIGLSKQDTNALLASANYPSMSELRQERLDKETAVLLNHWHSDPNPIFSFIWAKLDGSPPQMIAIFYQGSAPAPHQRFV